MGFRRIAAGVVGLSGLLLGTSLQAAPIIEETFTGYLDNALISDSPAGPALGLTGDWTLVPDSNFYVNKTQLDDSAGTGKAVYDRPSGDNGTREATRATSEDHLLFETDADVFYASFLISPVVCEAPAVGIALLTDTHTGQCVIDPQGIRNPYVEARRYCAARDRRTQLPSAPSRFRGRSATKTRRRTPGPSRKYERGRVMK